MNRYRINDQDSRPWGEWKVLFVSEYLVLKEITVNPGHRLSLQKHKYRDEIWIVSSGEAMVKKNNVELKLNCGDFIEINKGDIHRITNESDHNLVFHEFQKGSVLDEDDIERLEDDYSRS